MDLCSVAGMTPIEPRAEKFQDARGFEEAPRQRSCESWDDSGKVRVAQEIFTCFEKALSSGVAKVGGGGRAGGGPGAGRQRDRGQSVRRICVVAVT